jgi:hypothetical protein
VEVVRFVPVLSTGLSFVSALPVCGVSQTKLTIRPNGQSTKAATAYGGSAAWFYSAGRFGDCVRMCASGADTPRQHFHISQLCDGHSRGPGCAFNCWVIGTLLDTLRDLVECLVDLGWRLNWAYLLDEPADKTQALQDSWLAYYFLNGNMTIALFLVAAVGQLKQFNIHGCYLLAIVVVGVFYAGNALTLRHEIRKLIGYEKGMPHAVAYTRIAVSKAPPSTQFPAGLAGVGVFAIRDIPKDTLIFDPDDDRTIRVPVDIVAGLSTTLRMMYQDFCPKTKDGDYECPLNFNKLTVAWYLNDSDTPNVAANKKFQFRAVRDIKAGEELSYSYKDLNS